MTDADTWWVLDVEGRVARLEVVGEIGVDHQDLVDALDALDVDLIELYVDSGGGNAGSAFHVADALVRHPAPVVTQVGLRCRSAAVDIALAGDWRRVHWRGELVVHGVRPEPGHDAVAAQVEDLDAWAAALYATRSGGAGDDPETFTRRLAWWRGAMADERTFLATDAVSHGLVHEIGGDWTGRLFDGKDPTDDDMAEAARAILETVAETVVGALR